MVLSSSLFGSCHQSLFSLSLPLATPPVSTATTLTPNCAHAQPVRGHHLHLLRAASQVHAVLGPQPGCRGRQGVGGRAGVCTSVKPCQCTRVRAYVFMSDCAPAALSLPQGGYAFVLMCVCRASVVVAAGSDSEVCVLFFHVVSSLTRPSAFLSFKFFLSSALASCVLVLMHHVFLEFFFYLSVARSSFTLSLCQRWVRRLAGSNPECVGRLRLSPDIPHPF
jgi:hypothetical protein